MQLLKATLKDARITKFQKAIDTISRTLSPQATVFWIYTDQKLLLVLFDSSREKLKQLYEFRIGFFHEYEITENFAVSMGADQMKSLNKVLFNFNRLNIMNAKFTVEKDITIKGTPQMKMAIHSDATSIEIMQKFGCERIEFDEVKEYELFIEQKMNNKVLFLIANINTLEMLHLYSKGSLVFEFQERQVSIKESSSHSNSLQINSLLFKNYDFKSFDWVMQDVRGLMFPSNEVAQIVRTCNRIGVLILSLYMNTKVTDSHIEFHFIGDSHHQSYYRSLEASTIDAVRTDGEGVHSLAPGFHEAPVNLKLGKEIAPKNQASPLSDFKTKTASRGEEPVKPVKLNRQSALETIPDDEEELKPNKDHVALGKRVDKTQRDNDLDRNNQDTDEAKTGKKKKAAADAQNTKKKSKKSTIDDELEGIEPPAPKPAVLAIDGELDDLDLIAPPPKKGSKKDQVAKVESDSVFVESSIKKPEKEKEKEREKEKKSKPGKKQDKAEEPTASSSKGKEKGLGKVLIDDELDDLNSLLQDSVAGETSKTTKDKGKRNAGGKKGQDTKEEHSETKSGRGSRKTDKKAGVGSSSFAKTIEEELGDDDGFGL